MKTSPNGITLIQQFESFEEVAYLDQGGNATIGWGTTRIYGKPVQLGMKINRMVGDIFFEHDLEEVENDVNKLLKVAVNQNQFDALVSFHYNTGGLDSSTLLKIVNYGDIPIFESLFTIWNKVRIDGKLKASDGLTRRRKAEFALYAKNEKSFA